MAKNFFHLSPQSLTILADLWGSLGMFGSWDTYNDRLINYDLPAEVEKVVNL